MNDAMFAWILYNHNNEQREHWHQIRKYLYLNDNKKYKNSKDYKIRQRKKVD